MKANALTVSFGYCKCSLFASFQHRLLAYLGATIFQGFQSLQTDFVQKVTSVFTVLHPNLNFIVYSI